MLGTESRGPQRVERPLRKDRPKPLLRAEEADPVVGDEEERFYELHDESPCAAPCAAPCATGAKNAPCLLAPAMLVGRMGCVAEKCVPQRLMASLVCILKPQQRLSGAALTLGRPWSLIVALVALRR